MGLFDFGVGGAYKMFDSFMHPERGYNAAQDQLNNYYGQAQGHLQPYSNQGQEAYGHLNGAMQNLLNPSSLMDQWMNDYQMSDQAKMGQERAMNSGNRAASSMGIAGSSPALQAIQGGMNEIGAQDEQRYIDRMIQQYLQGAGLAQGIYGQGANAAGAMANNATNMGNNSAEMAFGKQNAPGQLFGNLLGTAANAYGGYMGANAMNNMANSWKTAGSGPMPSYNPMGGGNKIGGY